MTDSLDSDSLNNALLPGGTGRNAQHNPIDDTDCDESGRSFLRGAGSVQNNHYTSKRPFRPRLSVTPLIGNKFITSSEHTTLAAVLWSFTGRTGGEQASRSLCQPCVNITACSGPVHA